MQFKQIKNDLMEALATNKPKTAPYDTEAQVVRVEGSTAWVHIPGGVDETPVAMTINASAGDTVRVRVGNGTAWLVGNDTAPPTDDHTAIIAARQAAQAAAIARKTVELTGDLNQRIANANGLYETRITQSGGATITYMHNKPNLADSDIQMMISDVGVLVTANGTDASPTWYGLTVDGNLIANILQANGINADWINTGALVIYDDDNNEIFRADKTNKIFRWSMERSEMTSDGDMYLYDDGSVAEWSSFHVQSLDADSPWREVLWDTTIRSTGIGTEDRTAGTSGILGATSIYLGGGSYGQILDISPSASLPDTASITNCVINNKDLEDWIQQFSQQYAFRSYTTIPSGANLSASAYAKPGNYVCMSGTVAATLTDAPFTNSSFQLVVWQFTSSNQRMQIAWQNAVESYIRYRIRTDSGTWGSWHSLARQDVVGTIVYNSLAADTSIAAGSSQKNMASISCAAGIWSVTAHAAFQSGGTVGHYRAVSIGTSATNATYGSFQCGASNGATVIQTSRHITLTSTTTLYLNVYSQDAITVNSNGTIIEAVRLR